MPSFFDLQKYAATGIASADMTAFDKMRALAAFGGKTQTLTGIPPLSFRANGTPLISWSMLGNGSQSGTPTPDNPIMPQFVGVRTGNILPSAAEQTLTSGGITIRCDGNGRYHINGTALSASVITFSIPVFVIPLSSGAGGNGTFSMFNTEASSSTYIRLQLNDAKIDDWNITPINRTSTAYSAMGGKTINQLSFRFPTGTSYNGVVSPMFTDNGILPDEFEPYDYKIQLTCAGQTVPVYLGQVSTVRRVRKLVLDGNEEWTYIDGGKHWTPATGYLKSGLMCICTHYVAVENGIGSSFIANGQVGFYSTAADRLIFCNTTYVTTYDWKAYLAAQYAAGHPVTVWYVLSTPETGIVNEPLCKIGDYADELHSEDADVTIPTTKGQNTLTVDTELQPSSMTITYKG